MRNTRPHLTNRLMTNHKMGQFTHPSKCWDARHNQTRTAFIRFTSDTEYPDWDKNGDTFWDWNEECLKIDRKSRAEAKALIIEYALPLYQRAHRTFCLNQAQQYEGDASRFRGSAKAAEKMRNLAERKCTIEWDGNRDAFLVRVPRGAEALYFDDLVVSVRGSKA